MLWTAIKCWKQENKWVLWGPIFSPRTSRDAVSWKNDFLRTHIQQIIALHPCSHATWSCFQMKFNLWLLTNRRNFLKLTKLIKEQVTVWPENFDRYARIRQGDAPGEPWKLPSVLCSLTTAKPSLYIGKASCFDREIILRKSPRMVFPFTLFSKTNCSIKDAAFFSSLQSSVNS